MQVGKVVLLAHDLRVMGLSASRWSAYKYLGLFIMLRLFKLLTQLFDLLLKTLFTFPIELEFLNF